MSQLRSSLPLFAALVLCAGCAHLPHLGGTEQHSTVEPQPPVQVLLDYARHLAEGTPENRDTAVRVARQLAKKQPSAINYAFLALALGSPGQHHYTAEGAARYAKKALEKQPSPWDPEAKQYLTGMARLYGKLAHIKSSQSEANNARIADLKSQLDDARHKIKELSTIEKQLDTAGDNL